MNLPLNTYGRSVSSLLLSGSPVAINPINGRSKARIVPGDKRLLGASISSELDKPE
ncbi:hypothetical protein BH24ACI2_BH24ACI2_02750 [soil metagenome]